MKFDPFTTHLLSEAVGGLEASIYVGNIGDCDYEHEQARVAGTLNPFVSS